MNVDKAILASVLAALSLAACTQENDRNGSEGQKASTPTTPEHRLAPLSENDMRNASLQGELGCSFTTNSESVLLIAMGVVASSDPAKGLIKLDNELHPVSAPGGFDGMLRGATFEGDGNAVQVSITGEPQGSGESPPYPAELMVVGSDQPTINGLWTCGP
ncbi:hypothetical protein [Vreelandella neptunia]|uniref:Lipoprotein n=1 Tax=Vreelandella neptunia TaxID=115551 RepID=A0ABS9SAL3_9GAMM|nr:hypothetical protein [Halomonas neptunia]MCH4813157.1 hypothetical protein [Halomonas neptunia]